MTVKQKIATAASMSDDALNLAITTFGIDVDYLRQRDVFRLVAFGILKAIGVNHADFIATVCSKGVPDQGYYNQVIQILDNKYVLTPKGEMIVLLTGLHAVYVQEPIVSMAVNLSPVMKVLNAELALLIPGWSSLPPDTSKQSSPTTQDLCVAVVKRSAV